MARTRFQNIRWRTIVLGAGFPLGVAIAGIVIGVNRPPPPPCYHAGPETQGRTSFDAPPCPGIIDPSHRYHATIETSLGRIRLQLLPQIAPASVNNFVFLARSGFYDGLTFHRIENTDDHAYVQAGDPTGTGRGDAGYTYGGETPSPITLYIRGTVAMANIGDPSSNSSQFFIIVRDWRELGPPDTTPNFTFFAAVVDEGESYATLDRMIAVPLAGTSPTQPVVIESVTIDEQDREGNPIASPSPSITRSR